MCSLALLPSELFLHKITELKQRSLPHCDETVPYCFQGYRQVDHNHGGTAELPKPWLKEQQFGFCDTKHRCPHSISCAGQVVKAKRSDTSASKHLNNTKNIQENKQKKKKQRYAQNKNHTIQHNRDSARLHFFGSSMNR